MEWICRYNAKSLNLMQSNQLILCLFIFVQSNLGNLLRIRAKLAEKQYCLYKLHANYGRVFSEWSAIEHEMGDGLQV